jgi:hypothetical protein
MWGSRTAATGNTGITVRGRWRRWGWGCTGVTTNSTVFTATPSSHIFYAITRSTHIKAFTVISRIASMIAAIVKVTIPLSICQRNNFKR